MAGAGFDGRVIAALDHGLKGRIGKLAYVPPVLGALSHGADQLAVEIDGRSHRASWVVVANASRYGGKFVLAPKASILAPGLDVVLFHGALRRHRLELLAAIALGRLLRLPRTGDGSIEQVRAARVEISSPRPVPVQLDGDTFIHTPLMIADGGPEVQIIAILSK